MSYSDPISQTLTKVRNAQLARHESVAVDYSRMNEAIVKIMKEKGFISDFQIVDERKKIKKINVFLKYDVNKKPVIQGVKRISKPSLRVYKTAQEIKPIFNGYAVSVYSTNKGVMTGKEAVRQNVGGEFLFYMW